MTNLLVKDLLIIRFYLLIGLPIYLLYSATFYRQPNAFLLVSLGYSLLLAMGATLIEDRSDADVFLLSLPVNRQTVVCARYLSALLGLVTGLLTSVAWGRALAAVIGPGEGGLPRVTFGGLAAALLVLTVVLSLYFPLYFRFGLVKGVVVLLAVGLGLVLCGSVAWQLLAELAPPGESGFLPELLRRPAGSFLDGIGQVLQGLGARTFSSALLVVLVGGLAAASLKLSVVWYRRRDL